MRAVAAALAAAVLAGCATPATEPSSSSSAASRVRPTTTESSALVLRAGDEVRVSGEVVAVPHRPARLCAPVPVAASTAGADANPCPVGIRADGVDLSRLQLRRVVHGTVSGYAALRARYEGDRLVVTEQGRWHEPADAPLLDRPPCPAPKGGWGSVGAGLDTNLDLGAVSRYGRAHPGAIVDMALMRPTERQVLALVLTSGNPGPVAAALAPSYPRQLCVVRSQFSRTEIRRALRVFDAPRWERTPAQEFSDGESWTRSGQIQVEVDLLNVTPEVARAAAEFRPGLLLLRPFLAPWRH